MQLIDFVTALRLCPTAVRCKHWELICLPRHTKCQWCSLCQRPMPRIDTRKVVLPSGQFLWAIRRHCSSDLGWDGLWEVRHWDGVNPWG